MVEPNARAAFVVSGGEAAKPADVIKLEQKDETPQGDGKSSPDGKLRLEVHPGETAEETKKDEDGETAEPKRDSDDDEKMKEEKNEEDSGDEKTNAVSDADKKQSETN